MRERKLFILLIWILVLVFWALPALAEMTVDSTNPGALVVPVFFPNAGEYQIIKRSTGQIIEMDGFGYLMVPGKPMLPAKNFLIALPPGARAQSVEVKGIGSEQLPGAYQVIPTPLIRPLPQPTQEQDFIKRVEREWDENNQATYPSDEAYPRERG